MNTSLHLALALCCAAVITGCDHQKMVIAEPEAPTVKGEDITFPANSLKPNQFVVNPATSGAQALLHFYGRVVQNEDVTVRVYSPNAGRVEKLMVDIGQPVKVDDVLATILSPDFGQAQADFRKAVSDLALAERVLRRTKDLEEHGAAAVKDVESAQADVNRAETEKVRSEVKLKQFGGTKEELDGTYALRTPISGIVTDRNINVGQEVRPDAIMASNPNMASALFIISDPNKLWVMLDVTESDLPKLMAGEELIMRSSAFPGRTFPGKLLKIGDMLDPTTRTAKVRGEVDNVDGLLKSEMYVTVDVVDGKDQLKGSQVAASSVLFRDDKHYLFVEKKPGSYERREVTVADDHDGTTIVTKGITAGERVVVDGGLYLQAILDNADDA